MYKPLILAVLSIFLTGTATEGRTDGGLFTKYRIIGHNDGLADNKIQSIVEDTLGTCWVGTTRGINRIFEGRVINYSKDTCILNKDIGFLAKDRKQNIWAASGGLYLYDYRTDSFNEMYADGREVRASWCSEIEEGMVFCSPEGISLYSFADKELKMLIPRKWKDIRYNGFCMLDDRNAMASSVDGSIYVIDIRTGGRELVHKFPNEIYVKDVIKDNNGSIWFAIYRKGLFCFSPDGELVKSFTGERDFLGNNIILDLHQYGNTLYISTDGAGIFEMDTDRFTVSAADRGGGRIPLEMSSVNSMYFSGNGFWYGTIRHGLVHRTSDFIKTFHDDDFGSREDRGMNRDVVSCLCEDPDGNIWIGTDGGGIYTWLKNEGRIVPVSVMARQKIASMEWVDEKSMLVSIYNKGIYRFEPSTGKTEYVHIIDAETTESILRQDITIQLKKLPSGKVAVLTRSIFEYDPRTGRIVDSGISLLGTNNLRIADIGTRSTYLYTHHEVFRVDNAEWMAEKIYSNYDGDISCVRMVGSTLFVIRSYSLETLDTVTGEMVPTDFRYNGNLLPILEKDSSGNIWLATRENLIKVEGSRLDKYVKLGDIETGLTNDFNEGVSLLSGNGDLYFGGNSSFCAVRTAKTDIFRGKKNVFLLRVNGNGENVDYKMNGNTPGIQVKWNYNSMFIDVSTDSDNVFKANRFRYTVSDSDKQTVIYSDSRLSLPVLASGKYDIAIAYKDDGDNWIDSGNRISVTVSPHWGRNIAWLAGSILLIVTVIFLVLFVYHRREKSKAEEKYRKRKEKLSDNKLKFLTNISHELRTPLTLIYSPLKRLLEKNDFEPAVRKELNGILSQSQYMNQLINMVLDSRRLEEGFGTMNIAPHRLNAWIGTVIDEFKTEFENKSISLISDIDPAIGIVNFDESKFRIILGNLLMNAWKYSGPETTVTIRASTMNGIVRISVIDRGIGISGIDADKLFNRFKQGNSQSKGFGLGLAYTKLLVEAHPGGRIGAVPNQDKGSTFWFEIPEAIECTSSLPVMAGEAENDASDNIESAPETSADSSSNDFDTRECTLLIAEDEPDLLEFIAREMAPFFKEILKATDGKEALELAEGKSPSIIVSDVMMPLMNGYDLCRTVKNSIEISHIPVILLTAQADSIHREEGYKSGADIFLTKPFDIPVLLAAVRNTLHARDLIHEKYRNSFKSVSPVEATFSNADEQFIVKLDKFIESNIPNDSLNAQMIIEHLCMGRATFYKKVKEIIGMGIMEYVTGKRMALASELLAKSSMTVYEIAQRCGYVDNQYFSKVFKQHFGHSPSIYRKTHR
ncbi:MAG: response regulator [Candidatus Cryptobacteroides sp.]